MDGKRLINSISLKNILSFGNTEVEIDLLPLNVLVGPNGSGKSNFLECIRLLRAAPDDISQPIIHGGGIAEWLWKSGDRRYGVPSEIHVSVLGPYSDDVVEHHLHLGIQNDRFRVSSESIKHINSDTYKDGSMTIYKFERWETFVNLLSDLRYTLQGHARRKYLRRKLDNIKQSQSILSQLNDADSYPEIAFLAESYKRTCLLVEAHLGRVTAARLPQQADLDSSYLFEDASNLALVLNDLENRPGVMKTIIEKLKLFNDRIENVITRVSYGTVQIYIEEKGLQQTIPATRLSDGTLRFLCLLTILCHPTPPPLVCIEEPELGMHPDIIPTIAELLIDASQRTQLIVTTHSDLLVSKIREVPESLIICERGNDGTTMRRLKPGELDSWPEDLSLGEIWLKGAIGGTRW